MKKAVKSAVKLKPHHQTHLDISPVVLARQLADLRYDALADYLEAVAKALRKDAQADEKRKRTQLAGKLRSAASNISFAVYDIDDAWAICKPKMKVAAKAKP